MSSHKIIMENWRGFVKSSSDDASFNKLLESYDRNETTSDLLIEVVLNEFNATHNELLNEGVFDLIASAYETMSDGAEKLKSNISDRVAKALALVNEKYIEITTKIYQMIQKGPELAAKAATAMNGVLSAIAAFRKKHPILYKIILFTIACIAISAMIVILSSPAHAEILKRDGTVLGDKNYQAMRGLLIKKLLAAEGMAENKEIAEAIIQLRNAKEATEQVNIDALSDANRAAYDVVRDMVQKMRELDASGVSPDNNTTFKTLEYFVHTAKQTLTINGVSI